MRLALALILFAGMSGATPPDSSLRPVQRAQPAAVVPLQPAANPVARPAAMPESESRAMASLARNRAGGGRDATSRRPAGARSLRPSARTPQVIERAVAVRRERQRGAVCGDADIQGQAVGRVPGRIPGCGVDDAVRVRSVAGIALTQRAVMDCGTAAALKQWVATSARPALSGIRGGLAQLKVASHYSCRTRNHQGGKISEHGKGRAIDISGFHMRDGSLITVERGWSAGATTQALRKMHRGACGLFGTVLGPEADRFHLDHFHFDTARYRSGRYCR